MPEAYGPEEHLIDIFNIIEKIKPNYLIIDSISACTRIGSVRASFELLLRLLTACRKKNITCIYLNQADYGDGISLELSGQNLSSLIDTLILLKYEIKYDVMLKKLLVYKSRGFNCSNRFHEYNITNSGIEFNKGEIK